VDDRDTSFRPFNRDAEVLPLTRDHDRVDAKTVFAAASAGDPVAVEVVNESPYWLMPSRT
jgi:predicted NBD/HSP70 family sugar kinase